MSTTNTYNPGRTFYLYLSDDDWTTTYLAVCLVSQGMKRSRNTNKQDNQCGIAKASGSPDRTLDAEALTNLTPDAVSGGAGEASYKKMSTWFEADTQLSFRRKVPTDGSQLYQEGSCKIASIDDAAEVANNMTFSFSLEIEGALDETP